MLHVRSIAVKYGDSSVLSFPRPLERRRLRARLRVVLLIRPVGSACGFRSPMLDALQRAFQSLTISDWPAFELGSRRLLAQYGADVAAVTVWPNPKALFVRLPRRPPMMRCLFVIQMPHARNKGVMPPPFRPADCFHLRFARVQNMVCMVFHDIIVNRVSLLTTFRAWFDVNVSHRLSSTASGEFTIPVGKQ